MRIKPKKIDKTIKTSIYLTAKERDLLHKICKKNDIRNTYTNAVVFLIDRYVNELKNSATNKDIIPISEE